MSGRPSKYRPEFVEQARKLCELGATDADLGRFFEVTTVTIWRWQNEFPEFCNALKVGKEAADDRVERSLYHKANGYTFRAVKIFMPAGAVEPVYAEYDEHVPPDTTAAIFWLKNRRTAVWRDKHEVEHSHRIVTEMSDDELARIATRGSEGASPPPVDSSKLQ
jgi:hypothetical protein